MASDRRVAARNALRSASNDQGDLVGKEVKAMRYVPGIRKPIAASRLAGAACAQIVTAALLSLAAGNTLAQETLPPGLKAIYRAAMPVEGQSKPITLIHGVLNFTAGSRFPDHLHGAPALYMMVKGGIVVEERTAEKRYETGESYVQKIGEILAARNPGPGDSSMSVAFVLPQGAELTTLSNANKTAQSFPAPKMIHSLASKPTTAPAPFAVVQMVLDLDPKGSVPFHSHPGPAMFTVLQGEVILRRKGGEVRTVGAGDGWLVDVGQPVSLSNEGEVAARVVASFLLPKGEKLTTLDQ
jgi:quercetin dioxygenase-like cupin family protein